MFSKIPGCTKKSVLTKKKLKKKKKGNAGFGLILRTIPVFLEKRQSLEVTQYTVSRLPVNQTFDLFLEPL